MKKRNNRRVKRHEGMKLRRSAVLALAVCALQAPAGRVFANDDVKVINGLANPVPVNVVAGGTGNITTVQSGALEASHVIKTSAGTLMQVAIYNDKASTQYYLLVVGTSLPANGARPVYVPIPVATKSAVVVDIPNGMPFVTGLVIANSSTPDTLTVGSADSYYSVQVK